MNSNINFDFPRDGNGRVSSNNQAGLETKSSGPSSILPVITARFARTNASCADPEVAR
jgi:hypothetical protein